MTVDVNNREVRMHAAAAAIEVLDKAAKEYGDHDGVIVANLAAVLLLSGSVADRAKTPAEADEGLDKMFAAIRAGVLMLMETA